ncbi:lysozyme inhibitor LprI family protein [Plectonema cf. radiosum LEGE 06105]|uniref:Lysozyme inhibitor LprI family protein n=1 Tax=Plectonema cf. radiosum LEGE 06105 TaxID=945769 RepID=A0A8J7F5U8_9CYAN|nr:lysozyme inhibitor LprI family protein [Plectonema radiosum]MBE9215702.1 lysozyme inhibitor LprI family protein [Plectonema cf. radiosum LEGE 06105]
MKLHSNLQKLALISLPILGIVASANLAHANSYQIAQNVNCNNPQTTLEMRVCAGRSYEAADKKLNQVYRQLKPKLNAKQQKRLVDAQIAWIQFRDKSCAFEAGEAEGGTLEPVLKLSCLTDVTQQRVKDLERYLKIVNNR